MIKMPNRLILDYSPRPAVLPRDESPIHSREKHLRRHRDPALRSQISNPTPITAAAQAERTSPGWVRGLMALDKESSGLPEVDFRRRTTRVNLWMIIGIGVFFAITAAVVMYFAR
jgi:hypothetical protein